MKGSEYSLFCTGLTVNTSALLTSALYNKKEEYYIVVCSNEYKANVLYDKVTDVLGYENVNLYVMDDFAAMNEVYAKYFTAKPARSCVAVKDLPKGVLCEIEAIAIK